jgi:hypothetical protein
MRKVLILIIALLPILSFTVQAQIAVGYNSDGKEQWLSKIIYKSDDYFIVQGIIGYPNDEYQGSFFAKMNLKGEILDSCTVSRVEPFLYHEAGYFLKAGMISEDSYRFSKIPLENLFDKSPK